MAGGSPMMPPGSIFETPYSPSIWGMPMATNDAPRRCAPTRV
jgi:hypothetical protein